MSTKEALEISTSIEAAAESGAEDNQLITRIESLDLAHPDSVDTVIEALERLDVAAEYWSNRAKKSAEVANGIERQASKIRSMVKSLMAGSSAADLPGNDHRFRLSRTKPKLVIDDKLLPAEFLKEKVSYTPDRSKIEATLDAGQEVPGCEYVASHALKVYPRKDVA